MATRGCGMSSEQRLGELRVAIARAGLPKEDGITHIEFEIDAFFERHRAISADWRRDNFRSRRVLHSTLSRWSVSGSNR
jgi:hypothetical protein